MARVRKRRRACSVRDAVVCAVVLATLGAAARLYTRPHLAPPRGCEFAISAADTSALGAVEWADGCKRLAPTRQPDAGGETCAAWVRRFHRESRKPWRLDVRWDAALGMLTQERCVPAAPPCAAHPAPARLDAEAFSAEEQERLRYYLGVLGAHADASAAAAVHTPPAAAFFAPSRCEATAAYLGRCQYEQTARGEEDGEGGGGVAGPAELLRARGPDGRWPEPLCPASDLPGLGQAGLHRLYETQLAQMVAHALPAHHAARGAGEEPRFLFCYGDVDAAQRAPALVKSRPIARAAHAPSAARARAAALEGASPSTNVLLPLNRERHFGQLWKVDELDVPWGAKADRLVWRGVPTGALFSNRSVPAAKANRSRLVGEYGPGAPEARGGAARLRALGIDVGWSELPAAKVAHARVAHGEAFVRELRAGLRAPLSVGEMLRSRYLLSVEGNDVASNLKWALYSASTVLMPRPSSATWFMEDALQPGEHYVEVRPDFADLEERLAWCRAHPERAEAIARAGSAYVRAFLRPETECALQAAVLRTYARAVRVRAPSG